MIAPKTDTDGSRLRRMRMESKMTQAQAARTASKLAKQLGKSERFTDRQIRRWELMGTRKHDIRKHGGIPATLAELNILLRVYSGSPGYLIFGIEPARYPVDEYGRYKSAFIDDGIIGCIDVLMRWPTKRRKGFTAWFKENIRP